MKARSKHKAAALPGKKGETADFLNAVTALGSYFFFPSKVGTGPATVPILMHQLVQAGTECSIAALSGMTNT